MNKFKLVISSPDGAIFEGDVSKISLRGVEGELAVMAGHIPFVTAIKPCECKIEIDEDKTRIAKTEGGLLTVGKDQTTLLSSSFEFDE
jgi:F-type H+-transporting ATPase subunit epsilon